MKIAKITLLIFSLIFIFRVQAQESPCASWRSSQTQQEPVVSAAVASALLDYDIKFYHLDLNLERNNTQVSGSVLHRSEVVSGPISIYVFELHTNFTVDSIKQGAQLLTFFRSGNSIHTNLMAPANQGDLLEIKIWYRGMAPNSGSSAIGNGLSSANSQTWGNRITWSLSQPYGAYEWWPCKQVLTDKADSSWVFITTDSTNLAGSNGLLTQVVDLGNGKKRHEWKSSYPIAYYLISVAVGRYVDYSIYANPAGAPAPVLIQNYIYDNPQTLPNFQQDINETKDMIELFASLFGSYPFDKEKYGHCMAPFSGGMEHQTMTTQGFFFFELTAHELGHQWFGDHITCATWSDIWVNEGFASYTEYIALEHLHPTDAAQHMFSVHNNVMSEPNGSIWFTDTTQVNRIFSSRLSYNKGSAILHSIRFELNNDSLFYQVLRTYLSQYGGSNASAQDFKNVLETVSGKNFNPFFAQWFYGEGFPTFTVKWFHKDGVLYLQNNQTVSAPSITPVFDTPLEFRLNRTGGQDTFIILQVNQASQIFTLPVSGNVNSITMDPNNWIINQSGGVTKDSSILQLVALENPDFDLHNLINFGPNPFHEQLCVQVISGLSDGVLALIDIQGKILTQVHVIQGKACIPTETFPSGTYIARFTDTQGLQVSKKMFRQD